MEELILSGRTIAYTILRKNIKNTYLRVKPEGFVQITTNKKVSKAVLLDFIKRNETRIQRELDRLNSRKTPNPNEALVFGKVYPCRRESGFDAVALSNGELIVPDLPEEKAKKKAIEGYYGKLIWQEAMRICIAKATVLSEDFSLVGLRFLTQRMKSQFGSCQPQKKTIKLNTVLGRFDPKYLEAILIHEICHLKVQNHGPKFYQLLLNYVPDYRKLRRELNQLVKTTGV